MKKKLWFPDRLPKSFKSIKIYHQVDVVKKKTIKTQKIQEINSKIFKIPTNHDILRDVIIEFSWNGAPPSIYFYKYDV